MHKQAINSTSAIYNTHLLSSSDGDADERARHGREDGLGGVEHGGSLHVCVHLVLQRSAQEDLVLGAAEAQSEALLVATQELHGVVGLVRNSGARGVNGVDKRRFRLPLDLRQDLLSFETLRL